MLALNYGLVDNSFLQSANAFYWVGLDSEILFCSNHIKEILGINPDSLKSTGLTGYKDLIPEKERKLHSVIRDKINSIEKGLLPGEERLYEFSYRLRRMDGRLIPVRHKVRFNSIFDQKSSLNVVTEINTEERGSHILLEVYNCHGDECKLCDSFIFNDEFENLTSREKEIIRLICLGYTDKEIADAMCLSYHTVKTHRKHIVKKTGSKNTAEVITKFVEALNEHVYS